MWNSKNINLFMVVVIYVSNIKKAEKDYMDGMKYKDIAEKYEVRLATVKSWKTRYKWSREKSTQNKENVRIQKRESMRREKAMNKKMLDSVEDNDQLNEKQKLFCLFFVDSLNATQAYIKAFGSARSTAMVNGCRLLSTAKIKAEVDRLKRIKYETMLLNGEDLVEKQMRIAFSDMSNFAEFGTELIPLVDKKGKPLLNEDGSPNTYRRNYMYFKDSTEVDGFAISEIKNGKQGMSIKLEDRQKAMDWLTKYFQLNPADAHKKEFDNARLDIERQKLDVMKDRNKEPDKLVDPLIVRPIYGRENNDGE